MHTFDRMWPRNNTDVNNTLDTLGEACTTNTEVGGLYIVLGKATKEEKHSS